MAHDYRIRTNMPFSVSTGSFTTTGGVTHSITGTLVRSCGKMKWAIQVDGQTVVGGQVKAGPRTLVRLFADDQLLVSRVGKKVGC